MVEIQDELSGKCWTRNEASPQPTAAWGLILCCHSSKESLQGEDAELHLLATMRGAITPIVKAAVWYMKTSERK